MTHTKRICTITASVLGLAVVAFSQDNNLPASGGSQIKASDQSVAQNYWSNDRLANSTSMPLPKLDLPAEVTDNIESPTKSSTKIAPRIFPGTRPTIGPKDVPQQSTSVPVKSQSTTQATDQPHAASASLISDIPYNGYQVPNVNMYPYSAVGKLFFTIPPGASVPAGDYSCVATVFYDSHTVITARHCIFDFATKIFYTNFVFFPAYENGPNPAFNNGWNVRYVFTWVGGATSTLDYDVAFVQLADAAGFGCNGSSGTPPIWSYTGSLGVWIFGAASQYNTIMENALGYPGLNPLNYSIMYQDTAVSSAYAGGIVQMANPVDVIADAGPWIVGLNPGAADDGGNNTVNASNLVTGLSAGRGSSPLTMYGPAFLTYNVWNLYASYTQVPCF